MPINGLVHSTRGAVGCAFLAACAFAAVSVVATTDEGDAQNRPPEIEVRGREVEERSFLLTELYTTEERELVNAARQQVFGACMQNRGFDRAPRSDEEGEYVVRYSEAAIGDDGSLSKPPSVKVTLPNGATSRVYTTWTADTCMYRSYEALGSEPFMREALRREFEGMRNQADRAASEDPVIQNLSRQWSECASSSELNIFWSLIEPVGVPHGSNQGRAPNTLEQNCMTPRIQEEVLASRSQYHAEAVAENPENFAAWVAMYDGEVVEASSSLN